MRLLILLLLLCGCSQVPMKAAPGTSIARLSKITGNLSSSPIGGAHAESCQLVVINPEGIPCVTMSQGECAVNTCPAAPQ